MSVRMNANFSPGTAVKGSSASAHLGEASVDFTGNVATGGHRGSADNPTTGSTAAFEAVGGAQ